MSPAGVVEKKEDICIEATAEVDPATEVYMGTGL